jgi:radical SAM protein with 4Fe4S-binding SPASM domain
MQNKKRINYLLHTPQLAFDVLIRGAYEFKYDLMPIHSLHMPVPKRANLIKAGANLIYRKTYPWSWPLYMQVELVNYCNLKCPVCPTGSGLLTRKPAQLNPTLFERLINEVGPYLLTMSFVGWGEPLLHPQLAEILHLTQNRGITTFLSTNGSVLNKPSVLEALINYPPTYLIVAIDGLTDETNSVYRVGAKIAPALEGVAKLAELKQKRGQPYPILHHRFIAMKHNEHEIPRLKQFVLDNRFDMCTIRTLSTIDTQDEKKHQVFVPADDGLRAYEYKNNQRVHRRDFLCEKAFLFPAVFADGTVVDCEQDFNARMPYGSISDGRTFADVWWSTHAAKIRQTIRDDMDSISYCRHCPFRDRPVSDCSIVHLDLHQ